MYKRIIAGALILFASIFHVSAHAAYPDHAVTALVGFPPGGMADLVLRQLSKDMSAKFPAGIIVLNRPGAGGTVAISSLLTAKPNGDTFAIAPNANLTIGPHVNKLPYQSPADFQVIMGLVGFSPVIVVRADSPYKTLKEFIEAARKKPDGISIGYPGEATISQLAVATLNKETGIKLLGVPFTGWGEGGPALLGGHVDAMVAQPGEVTTQLQAGRIRVLGIASDHRLQALSDVPTLKEQGYDVVLKTRYLLLAPKGTAEAAVKYIRDAARSAMESASFKKFVMQSAIEVAYVDGPEMHRILLDEYDSYGKLLGEMNLKKD